MDAKAARRAKLDEEIGIVNITIREESRREILAGYADLPPLPPELPPPDYLGDRGAKLYKTDEASRTFYAACTQGDLEFYALGEASHGFQSRVVRYLMGEHGVKLHIGGLHKDKADSIRKPPDHHRPSPPSPNVIFERDNPALLDLLRAFLDHGWHPNQLVGPMQGTEWGYRLSLQEVALHYPRCLRETPILKFLLDAGADPTIAQVRGSAHGFMFDLSDAPVQRKSGDILHTAARVGTRETVNLLLSHGAKLEYGAPLHSLAKRASENLRLAETFEKPVDLPAELAARCDMADYFLSLGEGINGLKNVFYLEHMHCAKPIGSEYYEATPLSHALGSRDWGFAQWLLERGADPTDRREDDSDDSVYGFRDGYNNHDEVQAWIKAVRQKKNGEV